ncbi:hypothetical protein KY335_04605 [Candidatus Woesearchaeota archaeon]|nr:hypothetical protein [Candidatus Woesearchaeota archaeon]
MSLSFRQMFVLIVVLVIISGSTFIVANNRAGKTNVLSDLNFGEPIGTEFPALTEYENAGLASGRITTQEGTTVYKQYLRFRQTGVDAFNSCYFQHGEDDYGKVGDFLFCEEDKPIFEYQLEFESGFESTVTDNKAYDYEDEVIPILGKPFGIVRAEADPARKSLRLVMVGGTTPEYLEEGATDVYYVNGRRTVVSVITVSETPGTKPRIIMRVNGQDSKTLEKGDTERFPDGSYIGIIDVMPQEGGEEGVGDLVFFTLGGATGGRVEFYDSDITDDTFATGHVQVGGENINKGRLKILGTYIGDKIVVRSIIYRLLAESKAGKDVYVPPRNGIKNRLMEPGGMLVEDFDIISGGIIGSSSAAAPSATGSANLIHIRPRGDDRYQLIFTNNRGQVYNVPFVSTENGFKTGDNDGDLVYEEGNNPGDFNIRDNDYIVVTNSHGSSADGTDFTNVLRYQGYDASSRTLYFEDLAKGSYKTIVDGTGAGYLTIGGTSYMLNVDLTDPQFAINVDQNADGSINGGEARVVILGGGIIDLGSGGPGSITLTSLSKYFDDPTGNEVTTIDITDEGSYVDLNVPSQASITMHEVSTGGQRQGSTRYGALFQQLKRGGDPDELKIFYPYGQRVAQVTVSSRGQIGGTVVVTFEANQLKKN